MTFRYYFQIYSMTIRLEAFFEDQIKGIFARQKNKGKAKAAPQTQRGARKLRGMQQVSKDDSHLDTASLPPQTSRVVRGGAAAECQKSRWFFKSERELWVHWCNLKSFCLLHLTPLHHPNSSLAHHPCSSCRVSFGRSFASFCV